MDKVHALKLSDLASAWKDLVDTCNAIDCGGDNFEAPLARVAREIENLIDYVGLEVSKAKDLQHKAQQHIETVNDLLHRLEKLAENEG